ncbi:MAG TPA: hypothetical protein PK175_07580 [Syntrophales bacterium]|jgi:hypothetical protein|nr:hypothetical protein [Syntrophales bacterium]HON23979.1 hypothetical protein [Syntrophales bacterium]HOU78094.1 hypothetical protein [Syntrophales bacterium]HPC33407.1 hypothetical protein [Syntrophales bacterium]HQG34713.1 hypothetical protein [Syntrophales bacterium]
MNKKNFTSLDYPLFETMQKKSPRAARFWVLGDRLFQVGLLLTIMFLPLVFVVYTQWGAGLFLAGMGTGLFLAVGLLAAGVYYKRESYKLAIKAGIDVTRI